jgi:glycine/D-amino acid oxidase-like deaminating enzyme/nitrite reductase/ring-hydroxylating ferredoxin subunit
MSLSSFWLESAERKQLPPLTKNISVDALVVGGGLMGLTAAYLLSRAGQKVALIERDRIASGDTSNTTAHLTSVTDSRLTELANTFGDAGARALWDAGAAAVQQVRQIVSDCRIDCDLATVPGYLHLPGVSEDELQSDVETAARLEIEAEYTPSVPFFKQPGIRFPNQARFHPIKYASGLVTELKKFGCQVYEEANADEFSPDGKTVRVGRFAVDAARTVIATHTPIVGHAGLLGATLLQTKLYLYTSYALCAEVPKGSVPDCLFWDMLEPYNYLRLQPGRDREYVIYGGKDHKTGQVEDTEAVFSALEEQLNQLLSDHGIDTDIVARWSGQVIETNDGAPFIGETAENQFAATGFAGNGMTFGTLAAMMATDWVRGRKNPWTELLSPSRKKIIGGALDYIKENLDFPYYMVRDRLRAAEGSSVDDVKPGEGKILRVDGKRLAVYRDPAGELIRLSPVCTHLGCLVNWNDAEGTWDCPCHGSRFHPNGQVLSGPAETPLARK